MNKKSRLVCGVGINDFDESIYHIINNKKTKIPSYSHWRQMLSRCYPTNSNYKQKCYDDIYVCKEWMTFSNFKRWFDKHYIEGYHLDKDILVKGNKVYSPSTCCFVPSSINTLITTREKKVFPIGVYKPNHTKKYCTRIRLGQKTRKIIYSNSIEEAEEAYIKYKEAYIKQTANCYYSKGLITKEIYQALYAYTLR